jgi:ABC-type multidrug transport system fused ATPase/permease subunit
MDDIAVVDDGRIVEHGARDELALDPTSRFAHLLEAAR